MIAGIEEGLDSCDFILLILSPDAVDSKWVRAEISEAVWEETSTEKTKLLTVLYRDCAIPRGIRRKKHFDLRTNHLEGFRAIRTWLLEQRNAKPTRFNHLPTRPPLFIGREPELAELRARLGEQGAVVHVQGMPGRGKTTLALEFAHRYQNDFEAVYWLSCVSGNLASISSELARLMGLEQDRDTPENVRQLNSHLAARRCLLVLDNVEVEEPSELIPGGGASVLITTRRLDLKFLRHRKALGVPLFTTEQCFAFFRDQLGTRGWIGTPKNAGGCSTASATCQLQSASRPR